MRCNHRLKVNYDFLVHYGAGRDFFQEKLVNYTRLGEIQKYETTFVQHSQDYDFYNSKKLVDDFLLNVKSRIKRSTDFMVECEPQTVSDDDDDDDDFIDDENQIDNNVQDYFAFANVCRSVENALQDS